MKRIVGCLCGVLLFASLAVAEDVDFKRYNPDWEKYSFARSYITAISYFGKMEIRHFRENPKKMDFEKEQQRVRAFIEHLTIDNTELRISKNYIKKYENAPNTLMIKLSQDYVKVCDELINLNTEERRLWKDLYDSLVQSKPELFNEERFSKEQKRLNELRREAKKELLVVTHLFTKILLSEDADPDQESGKLGITQGQRDRLLRKLDSFAGDELDWGMKDGQSSFQAAIAAIREVLEDSVWESSDS